MKVVQILLVLMLLAVGPVLAQNYNTGIGLRGGHVYGLTVKHFTNSNTALEAIVSPRWRGLLITGLYEKHATAFQIEQLQYYGGIGAHVGFWNNHNHQKENHPWFDDERAHTVIGADLILGLEYTFNGIPINIGIDWKPSLNLIGHTGFWAGDVALSLRFLPGNM